MTASEILQELERLGDPQTKKTHMRLGAIEPLFGVKVADLKTILKKTKKNYELSLELYQSGNSDAMYLAGLMADEKKISKDQLESWVAAANWSYLSEFTVPWVAAETKFGFELGIKWIESEKENIASAGWSTLAYYAGVNDDQMLDIEAYSKLLERASKEVHTAPNRVRYAMNGFVIAIGNYVKSLTNKAKEVAGQIGTVHVEMNGSACQVPLATDYINKCIEKGNVGKKRKTARC